MKRPLTCPVCGSKISRITNATTGNSYFRCSNRNCFFVLSEAYTDADFYLQGTPLKSRCLKCGEPLKVASGPHGLYPRCFSCDCDTAPFKINGRVFQKWANARREDARAEVVALEEEFNSKNEDDQLYDFDEFIANVEPNVGETKPKKGREEKEMSTNNKKILNLLESDLNKPWSAEDISNTAKMHIGSARTSLLLLRSLKEIKVVGAEEHCGNFTLLYQIMGSPLPEVALYSREDGYNSITSFLKENADKYGSVIRARETLVAALKESGVELSLFKNTRCICAGYKISTMEKLMDSIISTTKPVEEETEIQVGTGVPTRSSIKEDIIQTLQKDLNRPFTTEELAKKLKVNYVCTRNIMLGLKESKKVKIVGWEPEKGYPGATALSFQLTESDLPRFKVTTDNNAYLTLNQFYKKKLRGKRCTSMAKARQIVENLSVTPLIINKRAYAGYAVADLKEAFKEYIGTSTDTKNTRRTRTVRKRIAKKTPVKINTKPVASNPITEKKSVFSFFSSLFKKEKIHS